MARVTNEDYTVLSERTLSGTGLGTSPEAIAGIVDLQRAVYQDQPADTKAAQDAADAAGTAASGAQTAADAAQASATDAGGRADAAQKRADDAYSLAGGKVTKATIAPPAGYSGTASATYTQAEVQALMDQVAALTGKVQAIVAALRM